ncbi:glycerophosphodiester phosphodiesterase family protein [Bacteroides sedimenti]|uniref:Glycerophosphoryl diester phosphodiesterase n=1 Tax=Bacteroides sedimenti TaxID=2136147 RepID=A0ABM8IB06_9BACE
MNKIFKNSLLLFCICSIQFVAAQENRADEIKKKLLDKNSKEVLVAAHRGDWRNSPENSLAAIENAIKMGVDIVEIDVKRTIDGKIILMHDKSLDRTTTGKGLVNEWSLDSIKSLRLKNGCSIKTKHRVPTLEEAMLLAKGRILVNLDQAYDFFDEVYAILEKTGTVNQVIMKGKQPVSKVKKEFGNYLSKVIFMPIVDLDKDDALTQIKDYMDDLKPVAFELLYVSDSNPVPAKVNELLKGKSLIWYNTLWDTMAGAHDDDMSLEDPDKGYGYLIDKLGARILQTDRPAYLIDYLKRKGLHD